MISRRDSLRYLTLAGIATGMLPACRSGADEEQSPEEKWTARYPALKEGDVAMLEKDFFTPEERETVRQLANLIIPSDERSGNAESAGAVEFIEFMMLDVPEEQVPMRGGLHWLDNQCRDRFGNPFRLCNASQQRELIEEIAYPETAAPDMMAGVNFFNGFRDYVATAFWTSPQGIDDLEYLGNRPTVWRGAPQEWLDKLGLSYD